MDRVEDWESETLREPRGEEVWEREESLSSEPEMSEE
jgi:hypothetical protein